MSVSANSNGLGIVLFFGIEQNDSFQNVKYKNFILQDGHASFNLQIFEKRQGGI